MPPTQRRRTKAAPAAKPAAQPLTAIPDEDGDLSASDRLQAEVVAEAEAADGSVVIQLVTGDGSADIRVPPVGRWRSSARAAIFRSIDDIHWAALTLSREDAATWMMLDPTLDDVRAFFARYQEATGQILGGFPASPR